MEFGVGLEGDVFYFEKSVLCIYRIVDMEYLVSATLRPNLSPAAYIINS